MNKDLDITPFPSVKEFAIGAMLPQCGSREGMSSDKRNILEVLLDDEEYMKETSFSDVKKIVDSFSREDLLKFSPSGRFVNSPNCIYRNVIKVGKYGGFIEVYKMSNSKNVGFISIAVQNEAQGNGIGTRLVNEMISNISGIDTLVWRCEKNNNASNNLAKKCGFKLSSETKNTNTYKLQLHNIEEYMKESYIFNENDYVINMDKWKPGVPLFITGASGDGKTTLSLKLAKENNAIILHGDVLLARLKSKDKNSWDAKVNEIKTGTGKEGKFIIDNRGLFIFFDYINTHNLPYGISLYDENNITKYFNNFIEWLIQTLPTNPRTKNYKYILESCNICLADPELISKFPLIISGTSRLTSLIRRAKRRTETHSVSFINALFGNIKKYNLLARKLDDNKDFFKTSIELLNINESGTSSDVDRIINTFTKDELKEFAPKGNPENHSNNVIYRDVKKVNGVPVAFIEVDQYPDDKKNNECNVSVGCDPKYRGNGYTKELLSKFIKTQGHKYNKIWYGYKKTNIGSKKLIESIGGFKNVGGTEGMEWQTLEIKESVSSDNSIIRDHVNKIHNEYLKYNNKGRAGNQNCLLCTWCFEARIRGYDILPRPVYSPRDTVLQFHGNEIVKNSKIKFNNLNDLKNIIIKSGDGSRFYIHVNWKNSSSGHEFLLININNKIYVTDPQAGIFTEISTNKGKEYFDINFSNSYLIRLDDKDIDINLIKSQNSKSKIIEWDDDKDISYMKKHNMLSDNDLKELNESALSADKRNNISSKDFGLPDQRKYPMHDKEHVLLAIKFFNYCPAKDKEELAKNIIDKIDYYFDDGEKLNIKIGDKNSFKKYWDNSINESCKDIMTARKFVSEVDKLAKKYNANYFIVTDGASGISNNGNPAVTNARKSQIEWEKKNGFDPNEDWSNNINEGYFSDLDISLGEKYFINFNFNDENPSKHGFMDPFEKRWNPIVVYNNMRCRERCETLILKGNQIYLGIDKDGNFEIPGGGTSKDCKITTQVNHECNEEAFIKVKDSEYIGTYFEPEYYKSWMDKFPRHLLWKGNVTYLFVSRYDGKYTGKVAEVDKDSSMAKGKFYKIDNIFDKLKPQWQFALNKVGYNKSFASVESEIFKLDYDNMEAFYEEVLHKQDLYPVFICSFEYESTYKRFIKTFTGSKFTHSGISFNGKLSEIFSFAKEAISGDHIGGFYIEDIKNVKLANYNNYIKIDVVFVNKQQYDIMQNLIKKIYKNIDNTNYNTANILNIGLKRITKVDEMNMICSTFVAYIFNQAGIKLSNNDPMLTTPADIARSKEAYIYNLFEDKGMNLDLRQLNKNLVFIYNKYFNNKYNLNISYLTNKGFYK